VHARIHYFVCDRTGGCATLEFLDGKLVKTQGRDMPVPAITNSSYAESRRSLSSRKSPVSHSSLGRFNLMASRLREPSLPDPLGQGWKLLDEVRSADSTQWQVLYELGKGRVHFRTRSHPAVKTVSLSGFDGDCTTPVLVYDMLSDEQGDVSEQFVPYEEKRNLALVSATLKPIETSLPSGTVSTVASYPGTLKCLN
jgi:choloylglycine hydrolase